MLKRKTSKGVLLGGVTALVLTGSTAIAAAEPPPVKYPHPPMPQPLSIGGHTVTDPAPTPGGSPLPKEMGLICGGLP